MFSSYTCWFIYYLIWLHDCIDYVMYHLFAYFFFWLLLRVPTCSILFFFLMIRRPPRSTLDRSSAASDVYKRQILIIDEVLAVGDAEFQRKCMGKMDEVANSGRTILFVSHNMGAIKSLCPVSYTHLRAHETVLDLVCRLLLEKKKIKSSSSVNSLAQVQINITTTYINTMM